MKFPAKGGADFEIPPAGNHVAICNMIVDMGMQPGSGQYPDPKRLVYIRFELCGEQRTFKNKAGEDIEAPMVIGRSFTASMSKKANLRKFIEGWSGKPFASDDEAAEYEFSRLPGKKCLLNVVHNDKGDKTYANIHSATPLPKGMKDTTEQYNKTLYFTLDDPNKEMFNRLPNWLQEKIQNRLPEAEAPKSLPTGVTTGDIDDDDIPF